MMGKLSLLVVEGNSAEGRARSIASGSVAAGDGYAAVLRQLAPAAAIDICYPADPGANLPGIEGLAAYDGIAITGSALNIYDGGPTIAPQVALIRDAFAAGTPIFGSCWGLQLATVAAGGVVRGNPRGREIGVARKITVLEAGRDHPLLAGRPPVFDALCVHLDEVAERPEGMTVLAANDHSAVQVAEIRRGNTVFWGVQYHPEYGFGDVAAVFRRYADRLEADGFFRNSGDAAHMIGLYDALAERPDPRLGWQLGIGADILVPENRFRELINWLFRLVMPTRAARGRS